MGEFERKSLKKHINSSAYHLSKQYLEPVTKKAFRRFMSKVSFNETLEKIEIKIQFLVHEFKSEHLDVQVIDEKIMAVKAEDSEENFEKKFQLPSNALIEKIDSKLEMKDKEIQSLIVNIPKDVKIVQI